MDAAGWAVIGAGALAVPVALSAAWWVQLAVVDVLHRRTTFSLSPGNPRMRAGVLFAATFVHESAHAIVSVVGGHGIREFRVGDDGGHVQTSPRPPNSFLAVTNVLLCLAPLYFPSLVVLLLGWTYFDRAIFASFLSGPLGPADAYAWWEGTREMTERFLDILAHPVVSHPAWWAIVVLGAVAMPAARPSSRRASGGAVHGDLDIARDTVRGRPAVFAILAILAIAAYLVTLSPYGAWYWKVATVLWALAVVGVLLAVLSALLWAVVTRLVPTRPMAIAACAVVGIGATILLSRERPTWSDDVRNAWTAGIILATGALLRITGRAT